MFRLLRLSVLSLFLNGFFPLCALAQAEARHFDIHLAFQDPAKNPLSPLDLIQKEQQTTGEARSRLLQAASQLGYTVRWIHESTEQLLLRSLQDSSVVAILWVGHTTRDQRDANGTLEIYNGHLVDSNKDILPRHIFTARHEDLQWLGIVGCDLSTILPKYELSSRSETALSPLKLFRPELVSQDESGMEPVKLVIGLKEAFEAAHEALQTGIIHSKTPQPRGTEEPRPDHEIEIHHRDLMSTRFGYELLINGRYVGQLTAIVKPAGQKLIRLPSGTTKIRIPAAVWKAKPHGAQAEILIFPNDANRTAHTYRHPIDNILIDRVSIDDKEVFSGPVNLGDADASDLDLASQGVRLFNPNHLKDLESHPWQPELRITVPENLR